MQLKDFISVIGDEQVVASHCNTLSEGFIFVIESERDIGCKWSFIVPYNTVCVVAEKPAPLLPLPSGFGDRPYKFKETGYVEHNGEISIWKYRKSGTGVHGTCVAKLSGVVIVETEKPA